MSMRMRFLYLVIPTVVSVASHGPDQRAEVGKSGPAASRSSFGGEQVKDESHIKEHLEGKVDITANMTKEQRYFHYFNMYDLNKDGKLDGIEVWKALTHIHAEKDPRNPSQPPPPLPTEAEMENSVDEILRDNDTNSDGFIDFAEFVRGSERKEEEYKRAKKEEERKQ